MCSLDLIGLHLELSDVLVKNTWDQYGLNLVVNLNLPVMVGNRSILLDTLQMQVSCVIKVQLCTIILDGQYG